MDSEGTTTVLLEQPTGSDVSDSGGAALEENKMKAIKEVLEQDIVAKGYSDKVKIALSEGGLEISIQVYAEQMPKYDNTTAEGRAKTIILRDKTKKRDALK